jgi:hypothetical protein
VRGSVMTPAGPAPARVRHRATWRWGIHQERVFDPGVGPKEGSGPSPEGKSLSRTSLDSSGL